MADLFRNLLGFAKPSQPAAKKPEAGKFTSLPPLLRGAMTSDASCPGC